MHILQFEYFDDYYGHNVFLKVHATFKHHYTDETMRYVQWDYMLDGEACSRFGVINKAEFMEFYKRRINKESDDET